MSRFMLTLLNLINLSEKGMPEASLFLFSILIQCIFGILHLFGRYIPAEVVSCGQIQAAQFGGRMGVSAGAKGILDILGCVPGLDFLALTPFCFQKFPVDFPELASVAATG